MVLLNKLEKNLDKNPRRPNTKQVDHIRRVLDGLTLK